MVPEPATTVGGNRIRPVVLIAQGRREIGPVTWLRWVDFHGLPGGGFGLGELIQAAKGGGEVAQIIRITRVEL